MIIKLYSRHTAVQLDDHIETFPLGGAPPPPWGGFLFTMFPDQEPGGRGPPLKNQPQNMSILGCFFIGGPLPPGF